MKITEVFNWLLAERYYQATKFDYNAPRDAQYWENQVGMYLHRAKTLGYDNPLGLQAMMKALATAVGMVEQVTEVYGDPPPPGVPSGEIHAFKNPEAESVGVDEES